MEEEWEHIFLLRKNEVFGSDDPYPFYRFVSEFLVSRKGKPSEPMESCSSHPELTPNSVTGLFYHFEERYPDTLVLKLASLVSDTSYHIRCAYWQLLSPLIRFYGDNVESLFNLSQIESPKTFILMLTSLISESPYPINFKYWWPLSSYDESYGDDIRELCNFSDEECQDPLVLELASVFSAYSYCIKSEYWGLLSSLLRRSWRYLCPTTQHDLKSLFVDLLREESNPYTSKKLCRLVSIIAAEHSSLDNWPELAFLLYSPPPAPNEGGEGEVPRHAHIQLNFCLLFIELLPQFDHEMLTFIWDFWVELFNIFINSAGEVFCVRLAVLGAFTELAVLRRHGFFIHISGYRIMEIVSPVFEYVYEVDSGQIVNMNWPFSNIHWHPWRACFCETKVIVNLFEAMIMLAQIQDLDQQSVCRVIGYVVRVAEVRRLISHLLNKESNLITRLLSVLGTMLAVSADENSYGMKCLGRVVKAALPMDGLPWSRFESTLLSFLSDPDSEKRHLAVMAFTLIERECSEAYNYSDSWVEHILELFLDRVHRVRGAAIHAIVLSNIPHRQLEEEFLTMFRRGLEADVTAYPRNDVKVVSFWLAHLPIRIVAAEAKAVHYQFCSLIEFTSIRFFDLGVANIRGIFKVLAEILLEGNTLATEETVARMKRLLKQFRQELQEDTFRSMCSQLLPLQHQVLQSASSS